MKNRRLLRSNHKGRRMTPRKPKFVAVVNVTDGLRGAAGKVIGSAKVEELHNKQIIHIDASKIPADTLLRGFSLGEISQKEEPCSDS